MTTRSETDWEKFNRLWDNYGHGSAKSWVKANNRLCATIFIETKRGMLKEAKSLGDHPEV